MPDLSGTSQPEPLTDAQAQDEIRRLNRIITVLMDRAERSANAQHTEFDMFQTALTLETQVRERTADLEREKEAQQRLIEQLETTQSQLVQSEKMSALGQLAAGIAHEINNPITYVNSNLGSLRNYIRKVLQLLDAYERVIDRCGPDQPELAGANALRQTLDIHSLREDIADLLKESQDGMAAIKRIVADLKDFSRIGESDWELADIHQCLERTLNVVKNEIKYKARVVREYGALPLVRCMPLRLSEVFMNLIVNAGHAIRNEGTISLRTGVDAETVWIEVEDDGEGIAPENLSRIFEPFFTTKPVGVGTGLGLPISYGIVQKHSGRIDVLSEPGRGTTFRVSLPIRAAGGAEDAGATTRP